MLVLFTATGVLAADSTDQLQRAIDAYRAAMETTDRSARIERFGRAELLFTTVAEGEGAVRNASLYVNLGNAALQAERLGPAILAYRRALLLDPDNERARQNLQHARSLLPEMFRRESSIGFFDSFFGWIFQLSAAERSLLAAVCFLLSAALISASIRYRWTALRNVAALPVVTWLVLEGTLWSGPDHGGAREAIVISSDVIARAADSAHAPARFSEPVPGGTEVTVVEIRAEWVQVRTPNNRDAWLPANSLAFVVVE